MDVEEGMKFNLSNIPKIKTLSFLAVILILLKVIFNQNENLFFVILFDLILILFFYSLSSYFFDLIRQRKSQPLNLIVNIIVVGAILLFLAALSFSLFESLFSSIRDVLREGNVFVLILSSFYSLIILIGLAYVTAILSYLFYLKQKKNLRMYFTAMAIFITLAAFSNVFHEINEVQFIKYTFSSVAYILIVWNSIRISWIAFLTKKEKLIVLLLSIGVLILFGFNVDQFDIDKTIGRIIFIFSPTLEKATVIIFVYSLIYFTILLFTALFHLPTAEAFERKAQEVTSLQDLTKVLTQVFDFSELAETVTETTIKVCKSDSAWLSLWSKKENRFAPVSVKNIKHIDANNITFAITREVVNNRLNQFGYIKVNELRDKQSIAYLNHDNLRVAYAPLKIHNGISGYLFASKGGQIDFDDDDVNAIKAFAEYSAIAIENSRLLLESIEKERLEKELDLARDVQNKILPHKTPQIQPLDISSVFIPAFEVGGDYFDFFEINENNFGVVVADVSGKGISAAFYMAEVKGIFESLSKILISPKEVLIQANNVLEQSLDSKTFVSAAYCLFDFNKASVKISRGGHCPILLIRNGDIEYLRPNGMGLGLNASEIFVQNLSETEFILEESDILVLFTDGITDARNEHQEEFGYKRFENIIRQSADFNSEEISRRVIKEITLFSQNNRQHDDITLVIIKYVGNKGENK
jgi:serine phosphatase RsbU (regulator of sigma subunit)